MPDPDAAFAADAGADTGYVPAVGLALAQPAGLSAATIRALVADARCFGPADPGSPADASAAPCELAGELLVRATGRPWHELVAAHLPVPASLPTTAHR